MNRAIEAPPGAPRGRIHEKERIGMKRFEIGILAAAVFLLSACSGGTRPEGPLTADDLLFTADGESFALWTDAAPLLEALGGDYEYKEAISCVYDGYDKTFDYGDVVVYTNPDGEKDLINEIIVYSGRYPTARGVAVGDTLAGVTAAYGDRYKDDGGIVTYILSGDSDDLASPRLLFDLTSGAVSYIDYYYPSNITG